MARKGSNLNDHRYSPDVVAIAIFGALGILFFGAFDFSGDYAINDDWGYSTPVRWWVEHGKLKLTHWQSMPLISQIVSGILWTELFGFSQGNLRKLTILFALISCGSIYFIARTIRIHPSLSLLVSILPLTSPIFLSLSYSFMSDIPSIAFMLLSVAFFIRSFRNENAGSNDYWVGLGFLLISVLLRQTAIGIALALLIAEPFSRGIQARFLLRNLLTLFLAIGTYLAVNEILRHYTGLPYSYFAKSNGLMSFVGDLVVGNIGALRQSVEAIIKALSVFGIYLLPISAFIVHRVLKMNPYLLGLAVITACVLTLLSQALHTGIFSVTGDIITTEGVGPRLIDGKLPGNLMAASFLTLVGHASATLFIFAAALGIAGGRAENRENDAEIVSSILLLFLTALIVYAPHATAYAAVFDRYALFPSLLLSIVVVQTLSGHGKSQTVIHVSAIAFAVFISGSLLMVSDYFRWQDGRYALIKRLVETDAEYGTNIDGGFEYNNLLAIVERPNDAVHMRLVDPSSRKIRLTKTPKPSDEILDSETVSQFLGYSSDTIFAVR